MVFVRFVTAAAFASGVVGAYSVAFVKHSEARSRKVQRWDDNWDRLKPALDDENFEIGSENKNQKSTRRKKVERNIFLVRHGQYNMEKEPKSLTELGRKQAKICAHRLKDLSMPFASVTSSSLVRAVETTHVINEVLKLKQAVVEDPLLNEGSPVKPEPCRKELNSLVRYHEDGPRIEAAFRRYFHRARADQLLDSYELIVCHANVIRYFVCRALQLPPEAWLRMSLPHCSITWLVIKSNGSVVLRCFGDSGFMPPSMVTY